MRTRIEYTQAFEMADITNYPVWERINKCSCWFTNDPEQLLIVLRSYDTIVALYDPEAFTIIERQYYSQTTTQHVAKFRRKLVEYFNHPINKIRLESVD